MKDHKISSTVNKDTYIALRGKLMSQGISFSKWLNSKMEEAVTPRVTATTDTIESLNKAFSPKPKNDYAYTPPTRCEMPFCKQSSTGTYNIETYNTDTGDETLTKTLCAFHKHKASKEGKVTLI